MPPTIRLVGYNLYKLPKKIRRKLGKKLPTKRVSRKRQSLSLMKARSKAAKQKG